jgi:3'-phosphoadenosine 5'-phosphosulfate sulfotransferase (PAPS reductase)/FAD synthetase
MTGIRASESIMRFRASVNKLNENYITRPLGGPNGEPACKRVWLIKPIYDWQECDIFKYLYDHKIDYAPIYDQQVMASCRLRVSTPLHAEAAKQFHKLRSIDPVFYEQVIDVFPERLAHERYYHDLDTSKVMAEYGSSLEGVKAWIDENYQDDPAVYEKALERHRSVLPRARRMPDAYPPKYLLQFFMRGTFKREILPMAKGAKRTK